MALIKLVARLRPTTRFNNGVHPDRLSRDPAVVAAYRSDPLIHHVITARCAVGIDRAMQASADLAGRLKVPSLILQAGSDEICEPGTAGRLAERIGSAPVLFKRYEGLYHELSNEPEKEQVLADLCGWMETLLKE